MAPSKTALFDDSDESDIEAGVSQKLKINDEYAKRFKHNKEREELHRLEEKYKAQSNGKNGEEDDDSSSSEEEDDDGKLALDPKLDAQFLDTLEAIRKKDPRIYDKTASFYDPIEATAEGEASNAKKEKPVTLKDYHRERLLAGDAGIEEDETPKTYAQEQESLQKSIRDEIQAQLKGGTGANDGNDDGDDFIKAKPGAVAKARAELDEHGVHPSRAAKVKPMKISVEDADKDPELYLSNFMASKAWVQNDSNWQAFESDEGEGEGDEKADEWEAAYNLRFEDPSKSNEVLKTYARDVAAAKSVRREEPTGRKKQRELEREKKETEKQERREEKNRLRRLKIEEAERKLKHIKKAAGLSGKTIKDEDWVKFLDDAWDNDKWEEEMQKTFGEQYYAEEEVGTRDEGDGKKKKKIKKPKWDDDIDIKDIIPDFEDEEKPKATLSDVEEDEDQEEDDEDADAPSKRQKTSKDRKKERLASQKEARQERSKIEALVDTKLDIEEPNVLATSEAKGLPKFAYRETWKESFGMTPRDILMAPDSALNEYAGLKKLAHFRPDDKKSKDKKRLGKKARLRQWRRETFGAEAEKEGPEFSFGGPTNKEQQNEESNVIEGKKRKRSRKAKSTAE